MFASPSLKTPRAINPLVIRVPFPDARRVICSEAKIEVAVLVLVKVTMVDVMMGPRTFGVLEAEVTSDKLS